MQPGCDVPRILFQDYAIVSAQDPVPTCQIERIPGRKITCDNITLFERHGSKFTRARNPLTPPLVEPSQVEDCHLILIWAGCQASSL